MKLLHFVRTMVSTFAQSWKQKNSTYLKFPKKDISNLTSEFCSLIQLKYISWKNFKLQNHKFEDLKNSYSVSCKSCHLLFSLTWKQSFLTASKPSCWVRNQAKNLRRLHFVPQVTYPRYLYHFEVGFIPTP